MEHSPNQHNQIVLSGAVQFLSTAGDEELLKFFRRLPMIAGSDEGKVSIADLVYEMELWPFVKQAWVRVEGRPGIAGRIKQVADVYKSAEVELELLTGKTRRKVRVIDLPTFVEIYSTEGMP